MANPHSASAMADAAGRLLERLDGASRAAASAPFADATARRDWHYVPRRRSGLAFADMDARQQKATYDLVATGLGVAAFAAVVAIIGLEDVLDEVEGKAGPRRVTGARAWGRHRADYAVTVFGEPGDRAWGWRFEGHHVSLNVSVVDGAVAATPLFLGANPAEVLAPSGAMVSRPLAGEEDLALALFAALDGSGRDAAFLGAEAPDDILTTNAPTLEEIPDAAGVRFADLSGGAGQAADRLVQHHLGRLPPAEAATWEARLAGERGDIRFAFAGEPVHRRPQYYRLVGRRLLVEYDNTQNDANHVHSVLRDPRADFGDDLLRSHRGEHH